MFCLRPFEIVERQSLKKRRKKKSKFSMSDYALGQTGDVRT